MGKRQGYTKRVLEAQIRKYEKVIALDKIDLEDWVSEDFGGSDNCPVCSYRDEFDCYGDDYVEDCLAIDEADRTCSWQPWFKEMRGIPKDKRARQILKSRLRYWRKIYAEKYLKSK